MARVKSKAATTPVPQSMDEANSFVDMIGDTQRRLDNIETEMNDRLAEVKAHYEGLAKPLKETLTAHTTGLQTYCEANRNELTKDGRRKFYRFAAGEISWRRRPPAIRIRGVAAVLERVKELGLTQFIRTKEEINKEAMIAEMEKAVALDGVTGVIGVEDFVIKPFETDLEEVA